ncbi:acyl carrier protein [Streptomyces sp. NPDC048442]|uniref:acyl carrier protein n=1 Tax=Streptomyces sp. NPDC048442 TaxID=3154823 RepID=UPI00343976C8
MTAVFAEVRVLMAETLRIPAADIRPDGSLDDLQVDSLAMAELCVVLESTYGSKVDGDRLARARTVDELVTLVEKGIRR